MSLNHRKSRRAVWAMLLFATLCPEVWAQFTGAAISNDGKTLAAAGENGVVIWNAGTGERLHTLRTEKPSTSVAFIRDERTLAVGTENGGVEIWFRQGSE